jgi:hypothetical protein
MPKLTLPQQVALQAEFIVNNLLQTDYQHADKIDIDRGIYDCDCNGFAAFVLGRFAPGHFGLIPYDPAEARPRAFEYHDFFSKLNPSSTGGWHRIDFLKDSRRGDLVAWRFTHIEKGKDTGHVAVVSETPTLDDSGNYAVRVYDSAAEPHYDDTRGLGEGGPSAGVGSGFINFTVDAAGKPIALQFGPTLDQFTAVRIAIGRIEPLPPILA